MKQVFAIILSSIILAQSFSKLIIIANYELNKDYISKALCENRTRPMMHCNGKCQLKKQLEKNEKQEQSPVNPLKEKNETQFFSEGKKLFSIPNAYVKFQVNPFYLIPVSDSHLASVFHPPSA